MGAAAGRAYPSVAAAAAPTLGITAVLAALWLLATVAGLALGGPCAEAAAALDPARPGSIVDGWGTGLLGLATILALSMPGSRLLSLTPALLLLGEAGELHLRAAIVLAGAMGSPGALPAVKLAAGLTLGGLALVPLLVRHRSCIFGPQRLPGLALLLAGGGAAAALLDLAQHVVGAWGRDILPGAEEWIEVWLYALLARAYLVRAADWSRIRTKKFSLCAVSAAPLVLEVDFPALVKIPVP